MTGTGRPTDATDPLASVRPLWPHHELRVSRRPGRRPALLLIPSASSPRMLVPTGTKGAHVMVRRHSTSRLQTLVQNLVSLGLRTGALAWLPVPRLVARPPAGAGVGPSTIEDHVRSVVPGAAAMGVLLGPPRSNAKPVLQVFDRDGRTVAFGKVGHEPYAARLVRHERSVLTDDRLRTLTAVDVPVPLGNGEWEGLQLLLMTALSSSQQRASSWDVPTVAMTEVAESADLTVAEARSSTYWTGLAERVAALPEACRTDLEAALARSEDVAGGTTLRFGRWHGDWAPWNMGFADGQLQLWDWERSTTGVPLGFDAVHFSFQKRFRPGSALGFSVDSVVAEARQHLIRWYDSEEPVRLTVALYVVEILHRYREPSAEAVAGPRDNSRDSSLAAFLAELVDAWPAGGIEQTPVARSVEELR